MSQACPSPFLEKPAARHREAFVMWCPAGWRQDRRRFVPPYGAYVVAVSARGPIVEVRLRADIFLYQDGPRWARRILLEGEDQFFARSIAERLVEAGLAEFKE